ncbi:ATP dependent RNA helicase-like protein [Cucurbitaria berberidis CBS 394.84]|uniref:RNA helicase n=1 Tax=Cucurbitaria berberidis CBS 394.84 TaxID=1168544 RepID=A0A9P4LA03_9PLEO|nr:ATP dependent RNA helicase-like protein [Cucurbitaria berberidis CBS 394.84]KAF1846739.1 ATP dependent RNA helicase-like protein [Cucurbitaria berberidis CBS 394.84]
MTDEDEDLSSLLVPQLYKPPALLPIAQLKDQLLYTIEAHPVTIIVGETGSGKTTQIPKFLLQTGWCKNGQQIAVTQPRRIAATSVAARVAEELDTPLGQTIGYSIRFEDVTSAITQVKFVTDGLLLREMLVDPLLKRYSVVMVDEAHERSLSSDILLSLLKKVLRKREDLRVVVSSATLEAGRFLDFFNPENGEQVFGKSREDYGRIVGIEGRTFPVEVQYLLEPTTNYVEAAVEAVMSIHENERGGDVLVFLTGREEIDDAIDMISDRIVDLPSTSQKLMPLPLYAGLPSEEQMFVFQQPPANTRKVIFSTNIAEASITIDGIVFVLDSGYVKLRNYDAHLGIENLNVVPVSKASATQRAGRAGRTRPGKCFRLYTEVAFERLEEATFPEIQRSNLAPVVLQLLNLGITNVVRFDYLSPPPSSLITRALDLLYSLGALDTTARLTKPLGARMAELPLEPMLSKALLQAANPEFGCLSEMLTIAAMMTLQGNAFVSHDGNKKQLDNARRRFAVAEGDHLTLYNVYEAFVKAGMQNVQWCRENCLNHKSMVKASSVRKQLAAYLDRFGVKETALASSSSGLLSVGGIPIAERVRRCLTTGFFAHAARMKSDGSFTTIDGKTTLWAHPSSVFFHRKADWVIYTEILSTRDKIYIRDLSTVDMDWLAEYAPEYYKIKNGAR